MIVLRQHALNQAGFMWKAERAKVKAREEGHRLRREAPEQRDLSRRQGRGGNVESSETLISCSIPAYLFRDLST